jgi:ATP-dependent Lon protease
MSTESNGKPGGTGSEVPAIHLLTSVVFPHDVVSIQLPEEDAAVPLLRARDDEFLVLTVYARKGKARGRRLEELHPVGVLCRVVQHMELPGGGMQAVFQGLQRARILGYREEGAGALASIEPCPPEASDDDSCNLAVLELLDLVSACVPRDGAYPQDLDNILRMNLKGPGRFADLVAAHLHVPLTAKREIAVAERVQERLSLLARALRHEAQRCEVEAEVHKQVREQIEQRQKEQYLRQQMRVIKRELGEEGSADDEIDQLLERAQGAGLPAEAKETLEREVRRLQSVSPSSAEYQVIRTYVGWLLDLPWRKRTKDRLDLAEARRALDAHHSGLAKVKERILEHLAVRSLNKETRGPILCLVGPPGVGKTSLGRAIAEALGRKFLRMSVGGLRDEAEIKGHRRTYVGAMPGKILQLLKSAGVKNPVLQIDEIDKMGADTRGDPSSAVLEALDPEVNGEFRDHYLDLGFDLSEVFFLATANLLDPIPAALRDRLEILRLGGYTREEKLSIARDHLVPRALKQSGLAPESVKFTLPGLQSIVDGHTREAGLREFERTIHAVCRKVAMRWVGGDRSAVVVGRRRVHEFLGAAPYRPDLLGRRPEVGVSTGLAWTAYGGTLLRIEASRMRGKGRIQVTGRLGEVMQESAQAALTWIRANCEELDVRPDAFRNTDIHIHFPEGATPKDGPSAGVAIATCLASLFTGRAVRHDLAMTGEITLKGHVLEVGGVKEKLLAAHRAGLRSVLIPKDNLKDLEEVPEEVRRRLDIIGTEDVMMNICEGLLSIVVPERGALAEVERDPQTIHALRPRG